MSKIVYFFGLFLIILFSCTEEPVRLYFTDINTKTGVFISCEGNYMYGNSSLSFYSSENKKVYNHLYYARNNVPLGDVAQSMALNVNNLFVVVNNSGKIVVIDPETAAFKGVITGLTSPRYMHFVSQSKAYVTDLYANYLTIINPETYKITGRINFPGVHTSEQMVQYGKFVFITSWVNDKYILVIDSETDSVVDSIKTPFQPKSIRLDSNKKIWVLTNGDMNNPTGKDPSAIVRIDPETRTIEQIYKFTDSISRFSDLQLNAKGDTLLFLREGIYKMGINSKNLPEIPVIQNRNKLFYSFGVNPHSNEIYVADAFDYTQDAWIFRYSSNGTPIDSFKVGINPSAFLFR